MANFEDAQLINRVLGDPLCGVGEKLLAQFGTLTLVAQNVDALPITERRRGMLRSAFKLSFVREGVTSVSGAADIFNMCADLQAEPKEVMEVILLNRRNDFVKRERVYIGNVYSSTVRVAEVFRTAIILNCTGVIIVHNHPAGDPTPSPDDVALTRVLIQAGKLLDIELMDHIIIGTGRYVSLKERGLGFN